MERLTQILEHVRGRRSLGLFTGETVLITGAARGIGRACALRFAEEGAHVVLTDQDSAELLKVLREVEEKGGKARTISGDLLDAGFRVQLAKQIGRVDHLINNAGFTWAAPIHRMSDQAWDTMQNIHISAPIHLAILLRPKSSIVNVSSVTAIAGFPGETAYASAKGALLGWTQGFADDLAYGSSGVRVNAVALGFVETRLTGALESGESLRVDPSTKIPLGIRGGGLGDRVQLSPLKRVGSPMEAANCILFLASSLAEGIHGHTLVVDGGLTLNV